MPQCQFLFSAVFVFQKSYTGNILGIGQFKSRSSYFSRHVHGVQSRDGGGRRGGHTTPWRGPTLGRAMGWFGRTVAPLRPNSGLCLRYGKILTSAFVSSNSENISCTTFLKYKNSRKHELALWHLVNRLVPENA